MVLKSFFLTLRELPKLSTNQILMGVGRVRIKKLFPKTVIHKIFEKTPSFHVKQHTTGEVQFLFLWRFSLVMAKFLFLGEE